MAHTHRSFVSYIDKSREFYAAHGYDQPYVWSHNDPVAFTPLSSTLADATVALITTSAPEPALGRKLWDRPVSELPTAMTTDHLSWHKTATTTDDREAFLPINALQRASDAGRIGAAGPHVYGVPTLYSRNRTAANAEQVVEWCRRDGIDVALLAGL